MSSYEDTVPQLRCVLPFEAVPSELCAIRRAVSAQLVRWGLPALAHEAELVVTELATNVIKHVGEGVTATLVMEPSGSRLRIELHDKSHRLPAPGLRGCHEEECGRGLHLVSEMATDWGTLLTATGKAVWCELASDQGQECLRVQRAETALERYRRDTGTPVLREARASMVLEDSATDLIADLLHWVAAQGGDPDGLLDRAQMHYEAESEAA
ncbi:ATP-binding protein [Streptomyces sp. SYSU K21746]